MLEFAAVLVALVPMFVMFHDDEIMLKVQLTPFSDTAEVASNTTVEESITNLLRQEITNIIVLSGGQHATMPRGMVQDSVAEIVAKLFNVENELRELRMQFGGQNRELVLVVTQNEGRLHWKGSLMRLHEGPMVSFEEDVAFDGVNQAINNTAKWALRELDPLTLLNYEFTVGMQSHSLSTAWAEVQTCRAFYGGMFNPMVENVAGMMYLWDGNVSTAGMEFRLAMQADPGFAEAQLNHALIRAIEGDKAGAHALLDRVANRGWSPEWWGSDPLRGAALALKGLLADHEGNGGLAIELVQEAVRAGPDIAEIQEIAAAVLLGRGHTTLARFHAQAARSLSGRSPRRLNYVFLDVPRLRALLPPAYAVASDPEVQPDLAELH